MTASSPSAPLHLNPPRQHKDARTAYVPRFAVLEITNRCNLRCAHCASNSGVTREDELSFKEIEQLLFDLKALGGERVTIIGGEPLLRDDWFDICAAVQGLDMQVDLVSNGGLITEAETLPRLKALQPHAVGVSLDGATPASYHSIRGVDGFDHILSVLRKLLADGHENVNAITSFSRDNLSEFNAFADLLQGTGITWQVQIVHQAGKRFDWTRFFTLDDYALFVQKMTDAYLHRKDLRLRHMDDFGYCPIDPALKFLHQTWRGCKAGKQVVGIRSNGDVTGCLSIGEGFEAANIRDIPLAEIWHSPQHFTRFRTKGRHLKGVCHACPHGEDCQAGCSALALSASGDIGENPFCIRAVESQTILDHLLDPLPRP